MIGNNTLSLNEATLRQAVQEWLEKRMTPAPIVTSIKAESNGTYKGPTFEVQLQSPPEPAVPT